VVEGMMHSNDQPVVFPRSPFVPVAARATSGTALWREPRHRERSIELAEAQLRDARMPAKAHRSRTRAARLERFPFRPAGDETPRLGAARANERGRSRFTTSSATP